MTDLFKLLKDKKNAGGGLEDTPVIGSGFNEREDRERDEISRGTEKYRTNSSGAEGLEGSNNSLRNLAYIGDYINNSDDIDHTIFSDGTIRVNRRFRKSSEKKKKNRKINILSAIKGKLNVKTKGKVKKDKRVVQQEHKRNRKSARSVGHRGSFNKRKKEK